MIVYGRDAGLYRDVRGHVRVLCAVFENEKENVTWQLNFRRVRRERI